MLLCYEKKYGIVGLMVVAVLGGSMLRLIIFHTPSMVCLSLYLTVWVIFVSLLGGWLGYELSRFIFLGWGSIKKQR
jgi:hypothetical protein